MTPHSNPPGFSARGARSGVCAVARASASAQDARATDPSVQELRRELSRAATYRELSRGFQQLESQAHRTRGRRSAKRRPAAAPAASPAGASAIVQRLRRAGPIDRSSRQHRLQRRPDRRRRQPHRDPRVRQPRTKCRSCRKSLSRINSATACRCTAHRPRCSRFFSHTDPAVSTAPMASAKRRSTST